MFVGRRFPLVIVLLVSNSGFITSENCWQTNQRNHNPVVPPPRILNYLASCLGSDVDMETLLDPLLITRTPGSAGNAAARSYIAGFLTDLGWSVEFDTFTQDTVIGEQTFSNIIATRNKDSPRRLVLAAHYDTKISPKGFIGATDSAVPCAMMLHLAKTMDDILPGPSDTPELTLQLVFFDGEEAFKSWTSTDSLYGSRHLANLWAGTDYQYQGVQGICQDGVAKEMDRIDTFLLMDLLGAPSPSFKRYTQFNTSLYDLASEVEVAVNRIACSQNSNMFTNWDTGYMIQDDHVPFYKLGIRKILHLIASPFPNVWHTLNDNKEALDMDTINRINKIVRVFVYSYINA
eukprot:TRINITY_DN23253_c0_g1_i1.p1 TRINITY_DN23253_c0_g1~~TRINITY_DN23253_c0_g1_i1.p1  ORF type:complete len:347 (-),score=76.77 TRINITY_DN23253_c0_g1_i1:58-1098(-)